MNITNIVFIIYYFILVEYYMADTYSTKIEDLPDSIRLESEYKSTGDQISKLASLENFQIDKKTTQLGELTKNAIIVFIIVLMTNNDFFRMILDHIPYVNNFTLNKESLSYIFLIGIISAILFFISSYIFNTL